MRTDREPMNWRQRVRRWWRAYEILVIWTMAGVAYLLGCWGFTEYAYLAHEPLPLSEILYRSLRLFVLHGDPFDGPIPWQLEISRFLAPAASALTAIAALGELFRHRLQLLGLRFRPPQAVVCGLGRKGLQLVRDLVASGQKVVVIEHDEQNDHIEICRDLGAVVLVGDGTEIELLEQALAHRAGQVFAVCGNDGINVEIAVRVYELRKAQQVHKPARLECWLHIVDPSLCQALKSNDMFLGARDSFVLGVTNIFENSARLLLQEHPLDREFIGANDPRAVHLVIVGFGQMGQSLALQAAKIGHFANGRKLRLTILDRDANCQERRFLARYPEFGQVCDIQFIHSDFEVSDFFNHLRQWGTATDTLLSIAICLDNDSISLRCALTLAGRMEGTEVPLYVRMEEDVGLASLLNCRHQDSRLLRRIHAFGQINLSAALTKWTSQEQDELAKLVHEKFSKMRTDEGRPADAPSQRDWNDLDEIYKDSNRQFADQIPVKLRAVRCVIDPSRKGDQAVGSFTQPESDLLAKMEHARWNAERFLGGWQLGPEDRENKITPHLVKWEALPGEIKKYDYELVALIPQLINTTDQQIYRAANTPAQPCQPSK